MGRVPLKGNVAQIQGDDTGNLIIAEQMGNHGYCSLSIFKVKK